MSSSTTDKLQTVAFLNPDGKIAVVVLNLSDQMQSFNLWLGGKSVKNNSPPYSIITLLVSQIMALIDMRKRSTTITGSITVKFKKPACIKI